MGYSVSQVDNLLKKESLIDKSGHFNPRGSKIVALQELYTKYQDIYDFIEAAWYFGYTGEEIKVFLRLFKSNCNRQNVNDLAV